MSVYRNKSLERAIHVIFILLGSILLVVAGFLAAPENFWIPLMINLGTSFIVVALIFAITTVLPDEISQPTSYSAYNGNGDLSQNYSQYEREETYMERKRLINGSSGRRRRN